MTSKRTIPILLAALLLAPATTLAQAGGVDLRVLDDPVPDLKAHAERARTLPRTAPTGAGLARGLGLSAGVDSKPRTDSKPSAATPREGGTSDVLLLPYFEVDRGHRSGVTTLFAVRNETDHELPVRILYVGALGGAIQTEQEIVLAPAAVRTVNLRDVAGLRADDDGIARGLVVLGAIGDGEDAAASLSGDFFFIDPATDYATGNTLLDMSLDAADNELCAGWSSRFFRGGSFSGATSFRFVVDVPSGSAPFDPPTAIGTVYDEAGTAVRSFEIRTDLNTFRLTSEDLVPEGVPFGAVSVRFPSTEGALLVEHSGFHRLSVALRAACLD
ncbi:MAG: hypothetical protein PVG07_01930 [Acidobacteriota bacterium]|jgi:hypothetical protein